MADVRRDLETGRDLRNSLFGRALLRISTFRREDTTRPRQGYETAISDNPTWDNFARLGYLKYTLGDFSGAEQCYIDAEDELNGQGIAALCLGRAATRSA